MADYGWLVGLIIVIALFALGAIVYRMRHPRKRPDPNARHAPEGRTMVRRGAPKRKQSGPFDHGPQVPQDPSSVPKFNHHNNGM